MTFTTPSQRRHLEALDRQPLAQHQLDRLAALLADILPANRFYADKLAGMTRPPRTLDELTALPFTTKEELVAGSDDAGRAANHTWPAARYARFHQTSGTRGRPLVVLDTAEDWRWWIDCWQYVLDAAEITADDRALMAFSFGPFIGFWSAHDAVVQRGALVVPCGGLGTLARLQLLEATRATAVFCTPTYALRMAEVAREERIDVASLGVRRVVVAGEPGGSLPEVRGAIEQGLGGRVVDHSGATEVGPWGYGDAEGRGLWVMESEFIAELISVESGRPAQPGQLAELVLTNLGRRGAPLIRYRTGDLVRSGPSPAPARKFLFLAGGVLGRTDDMMIIRGVNVFPSSIDAVLRSFPEVAEYRMTARRQNQLDQLHLEVEDRAGRPERIAKELQARLGLKVEVAGVPLGSLPRFEAKAKRFIDER